MSRITALTRSIAAFVLGVHAESLRRVANKAQRVSNHAWARVDQTRDEIVDLERLLDVRIDDAEQLEDRATDTALAVQAELDILPFVKSREL